MRPSNVFNGLIIAASSLFVCVCEMVSFMQNVKKKKKVEWDANIYATEPATTILRRKKYITIATMNHLYVLSQF